MSTLQVTPPAAARRAEPARPVPWWVEALGVLLAPGVVALLLGVGPVLPTHLGLGDVVPRYVLALVATVPAYLWLRRRSLAAGALAVAVILTSPVVLVTWSSDRSAGTALAFLFAGLPLLGFWTTGVRRLLVRGIAGVFLGLAVHTHPAAAPLVVGALVALAASAYSRHTGVRRARVRRVSVELAAVLGGLVLVTLPTVLGAVLHGRADVASPAFDQLVRQSEQPRLTAVLVPPVVVIAWAWLCRRRRRLLGESPPSGDAVVVLGSGLGCLAFLAIPAVDGSSLLWAGACLTTTLLLSTSSSSSWWTVGVVLGVATLQARIGTPRFEMVPSGLVLACAVVVAAAVMGGERRRPMPMLVVTIGLALLTTG